MAQRPPRLAQRVQNLLAWCRKRASGCPGAARYRTVHVQSRQRVSDEEKRGQGAGNNTQMDTPAVGTPAVRSRQWVSDGKKGDKGAMLCLVSVAPCLHSKATLLEALCRARCAPLAGSTPLKINAALLHTAHGLLNATSTRHVDLYM